jgi:ATP synthase F1 delta subunit
MTEPRGGLTSTAKDIIRGLAEKAGLDDLREVLEQIERRTETDEADAEVWSAVPLTDAETRALEDRLRGRRPDLDVSYHVDPALLGGLIVRVGDRYVDGSLATRLGKLRQELLTGRAA